MVVARPDAVMRVPRSARPPDAGSLAADIAPSTSFAKSAIRQRIIRLMFMLISAAALAFGWYLARREQFIPDEGMGYWLGIAGGTMLLAQLAYPLRKRAQFMRRFGAARTWFRLHLLLGVAGPIVILYHSNYSLGAINSNVALLSMLTVAASGVVGRYFYGRLHNSVSGAKSDVHELLTEAVGLLRVVEVDVGGSGGALAESLAAYSETSLRFRRGAFAQLAAVLGLCLRAPWFRRSMLRRAREAIGNNATRRQWSSSERRAHLRAARSHIGDFVEAVTRAAQLGLYERLFALWHVLHLPLFILLIVTGIVHVVSVHFY